MVSALFKKKNFLKKIFYTKKSPRKSSIAIVHERSYENSKFYGLFYGSIVKVQIIQLKKIASHISCYPNIIIKFMEKYQIIFTFSFYFEFNLFWNFILICDEREIFHKFCLSTCFIEEEF